MKLESFSQKVQDRIRKQLFDEANRKTQSPVVEPAFRNEPLAKEEGKTGDPKRLHVSVTSYRRRLIDPDNLVFKYGIDACRYCGWIPDDSEKHIEYSIKQVKVQTKDQERTEISIT